jgi:hypothetical protein
MRTTRGIFTLIAALAGLAMLIAGPIMIFKGFNGQSQIRTELSAQKIVFPAAGSESLPAALQSYAGQSVTTGPQAKAYSDMVETHVLAATSGQTYSQVSGTYQAMTDKTSATALKLSGLRQTAFMGESLRGSLLGAYQAWEVTMLVIGLGALVTGLGIVMFAAAAVTRPRKIAVPNSPEALAVRQEPALNVR